MPNTGVALTMDVDDLEELHFTNKQLVGRRMADWALASVYGRQIPYRGPVYKSISVEGDKIRIHFSHTATGLVTNDGRPPSHFTIAGPDKTFHPASAIIDGHTVVVHSPKVPPADHRPLRLERHPPSPISSTPTAFPASPLPHRCPRVGRLLFLLRPPLH